MEEEVLRRENGEKGEPVLARKIADTIIARWTKEAHHESDSPFLLFLGGLQGTGKTSTIDELRMASGLDFVTVSADEIRFEMFVRQISLTAETGEVWRQTVNLTRKLLLEEAFKNRWSVVIDQMITPERVKAVEEVARQFPESAYRIKKVYLQADRTVLQERVANRAPKEGKYTGTLGELNDSLEKYGVVDTAQFDWVINTGRTTIDAAAREIANLFR